MKRRILLLMIVLAMLLTSCGDSKETEVNKVGTMDNPYTLNDEFEIEETYFSRGNVVATATFKYSNFSIKTVTVGDIFKEDVFALCFDLECTECDNPDGVKYVDLCGFVELFNDKKQSTTAAWVKNVDTADEFYERFFPGTKYSAYVTLSEEYSYMLALRYYTKEAGQNNTQYKYLSLY